MTQKGQSWISSTSDDLEAAFFEVPVQLGLFNPESLSYPLSNQYHSTRESHLNPAASGSCVLWPQSAPSKQVSARTHIAGSSFLHSLLSAMVPVVELHLTASLSPSPEFCSPCCGVVHTLRHVPLLAASWKVLPVVGKKQTRRKKRELGLDLSRYLPKDGSLSW